MSCISNLRPGMLYYAGRGHICKLCISTSFRSCDSCPRYPEPKHHSFLFNHRSASKCLLFMAARTPSIHVFLGRPLFLLSPGIHSIINPLNAELNPTCYLLALLGAHHFLHVSRIRVKLLTFRLLMSYIWSTHS